jgi:hypothetical protein
MERLDVTVTVSTGLSSAPARRPIIPTKNDKHKHHNSQGNWTI